MNNQQIPFIQPILPDTKLIQTDLDDIYKSGFYSNHGPMEKIFTKKLEEYLGGGIKVSINCNATLGLIMAVKQLFIKNRKNVLIQSFTFASGGHAILWSGYQPVFMDIDTDDWQPDIEKTKSYLKNEHNNTAGIIICNTFGSPNGAIDEWELLAKKYKLPLIVDSAAGLGSLYPSGEKIGGKGNCEIFSFHATKPFGIGEGGAITSTDFKLIEMYEKMKNFSFDKNGFSEFIGINAKATELNAAIGIRVLEKFDTRLDKRRKILNWYKKHLDKKKIIFQKFDNFSTVPFVSVLVPKNERNHILDVLKANNITARKYYHPPLHIHPVFRKYKSNIDLINTEFVSESIVSLPALESFVEKDVLKICQIINKLVNKQKVL